MPRQTKDTQSKNTAVAQETATTQAVSAPAADTSAAPKRRGGKAAAATQEPATSPTPTQVVAPVATSDNEGGDASDATRAPRVAPTRESVMAEFSELLNLVETEISRLRDQGDKSSATRFLRTVVQKRVRTLQASTARVLRHKAPSARRNNNSGFLKPVNISSDIAKFTGLDPKSQHSRVDVTKFLCKYISDKNLQNPEDRRQINADPALSKLLGFDNKAGKPLTYYHMQSLLKNHFTKPQ
uniref:DM2 domain-containing protein n=1 Tax=viral metagenome TaxID=1070528 RepID=A0A6C0KQ96_9ZZZZ